MQLTDHLRLIWPQRPHIAQDGVIVFDDGLAAPTPDELDATRTLALALYEHEQASSLPPITARQLRLWLAGAGILIAVEGLIAGLPEPQRTMAGIEWEFSLTYERAHPLVIQLGASLGLTSQELDTAWVNASKL